MTYEQLMEAIRQHGNTAQPVAGKEYIRVLDVYTDGTQNWILVEATPEAVRAFLGY